MDALILGLLNLAAGSVVLTPVKVAQLRQLFAGLNQKIDALEFCLAASIVAGAFFAWVAYCNGYAKGQANPLPKHPHNSQGGDEPRFVPAE